MLIGIKRVLLTGSLIVLTMTCAHADRLVQPLSGVDSELKTIVTKSKISGGLAKDANGNLAMDANMNYMFDFTGKIFHPITNPFNGELKGTSGPIGKVSGQAGFPPAFAGLAIQVYDWLMKGADPAQMPTIPPNIDWVMNDLKVIVGGTTYTPLSNLSSPLRAFTGLGPVEIGKVLNGSDGLSMSVRMGGCIPMQGIDGPYKGKIGTQCLNGTFTFDLSGINLNNPMASTLNGTGTSNCWMVLQDPMQ